VSLTLTVRPVARTELNKAVDWYEAEKPGLGDRFTDAVRRVFAEITTNPRRYAVEYKDVREAMVEGFPYCVYFRVRANRAIVISVFHTSRDPSGSPAPDHYFSLRSYRSAVASGR
jgi:plasmid stabilization system protein ParE